tara:strand:+ start:2914 stop:4056 length:1143 start_codon:yes stop_codon:yes gene_type:complete
MKGSIIKRGGTYYYQCYPEPNKKVRKTLKTRDLQVAKARAREMEKDFLLKVAQGDLDSLKTKKPATLGAIADCYLTESEKRGQAGHKMASKTAIRNVRSLERVSGGLDQRASVLTTRGLDRFCFAKLDGKRGQELVRARNAVASVLRKARSVFADWALAVYKRESLVLPDGILEWRKHRPVKEDHGNYRLPLENPDLVQKCKKAGQELVVQAEHLSGAWILCYELALRAKEASSVKWNWFVRRGDHYGLLIVNRPNDDFRVKGTEREIQVHSAVYDTLRNWADSIKPDYDYCLPFDSFNKRYNYITRDLADWMRDLGFGPKEFHKCAHELRKLKGSEWYSDPNLGPAVAQEWLGHKDISTTCKYYASLDRVIQPPTPEWS